MGTEHGQARWGAPRGLGERLRARRVLKVPLCFRASYVQKKTQLSSGRFAMAKASPAGPGLLLAQVKKPHSKQLLSSAASTHPRPEHERREVSPEN